MMLLRSLLVFTLLAALGAQVSAAINPEEFKKAATDVLKLREVARIQAPEPTSGRQRITLVAEVVDIVRSSAPRESFTTVVIDYTIDLTSRESQRNEYAGKMRRAAGRQFMFEPDAPQLDEQREFWAHLVRVAADGRGGRAFAGHVDANAATQISGPVFAPAAGQYSWDVPKGRGNVMKPNNPPVPPSPASFTGTLKTGIMAVGGETTGVLLETEAGTYELDLRGNADANAAADELNGKRVIVTGDYRPRRGVEVKERRIIVVRTLRAAP